MTAFTYEPVGCTRPGAPAPVGFHVHHREAVIGNRADWDKARAALLAWRMFDLDWVTLLTEGPPSVGGIATVNAQVGPLRLTNPCKVIELYESDDHFGFSYGTLEGHAMSGEERFSIHRDGDEVRYEILAYSKPGTLLARLGLPVVRRLQRRFGTESLEAMSRALSA